MKFGRYLSQNLTLEWSRYYIPYKNLKRLLKYAHLNVNDPSSLTRLQASFMLELDQSVDNLMNFLEFKIGSLEERLKPFLPGNDDRNFAMLSSSTQNALTDLSSEQRVEDLIALLDTLTQMKHYLVKLIDFIHLNSEAVRKIIKKYRRVLASSGFLDSQKEPSSGLIFADKENIFAARFASMSSRVSSIISLMHESHKFIDNKLVSVRSGSSPPTSALSNYASFDALESIPEKPVAFTELFSIYQRVISLDFSTRVLEAIKANDASTLNDLLTHCSELLSRASACYVSHVGGTNAENSSVEPSDGETRVFSSKLLSPEPHGTSADGDAEASSSDSSISLAAPPSEGLRYLRLIQASVHKLLNQWLREACKQRQTEMIPVIKQHGADVDQVLPLSGKSLLHILAERSGHLKGPGEGDPVPMDSSEDDPSIIATLISCSANRSYRDAFGRLPLHYAAAAGHLKCFQCLLEGRLEDLKVADYDGFSPVDLIINHGRLPLLQFLKPQLLENDQNDMINLNSALFTACFSGKCHIISFLLSLHADPNAAGPYGDGPLHIAVRHNHPACVATLIDCGANVDLQEKYHEWTPLFVAVIEGNAACCKILLDAGAKIDFIDASGWTVYQHALFRGHSQIAQLIKGKIASKPRTLVRPNAPSTATPSPPLPDGAVVIKTKEYGHRYLHQEGAFHIYPGLNIDGTTSQTPFVSVRTSEIAHPLSNLMLKISVEEPLIGGPFQITALQHHNMPTPFEPFTFQFFCDRRTSDPSSSIPIFPTEEKLSFGDKASHLSSSSSKSKPGNWIVYFQLLNVSPSLPPLTVAGSTANPTNPAPLPSQTEALALGAFDLSSIEVNDPNSYSGESHLESFGFVEVPLLSYTGPKVKTVGKVSFSYLVLLPFQHHSKNLSESPGIYWKSLTTKIIGHRGLGANRSLAEPQVEENTILSFVTAASLGAEYVEFDVQMTKDLVPVLYHDWIMSESDLNTSVSQLYFDEFMRIRRTGNSQNFMSGSGSKDDAVNSVSYNLSQSVISYDDSAKAHRQAMGRSLSMSVRPEFHFPWWGKSSARGKLAMSSPMTVPGGPPPSQSSSASASASTSASFSPSSSTIFSDASNNRPPTPILSSNLKRHYDFPLNIITTSFTTLREAFQKVPPDIGFNIELKYPCLEEIRQYRLDPPIELNRYCDAILDCVYTFGRNRPVIFSSFNPQVCIALHSKQPNFPVFFLCDAGDSPALDARSASIQGAIRFAKHLGLLGIVISSTPLIEEPNLINVIKSHGLILFTYGAGNNSVENAKLQTALGVDAVIVDNVAHIRKGMSKQESSPASPAFSSLSSSSIDNINSVEGGAAEHSEATRERMGPPLADSSNFLASTPTMNPLPSFFDYKKSP